MLGALRTHPFLNFPACVIGGAALKCLLIQVNQLAVNKLRWRSIDYHDGKNYLSFQSTMRSQVQVTENRHGIPPSSQPAVALWVTILSAAGEQIVYRFLLERKILPRMLPPSINTYAWLFRIAITAEEAYSLRSFSSTERASMMHWGCIHAICFLAQHRLGLPGAICIRIGSGLYDIHYRTGYLLSGATFTNMNPLYLIHWRTVALFFSACYTASVPPRIQNLLRSRGR